MSATITVSEPKRALEKLLLQVERQPFAALYRAAIGFLLTPVFDKLGGHRDPGTFSLYFIGVLLLLRLVPLVIRKVVPFSNEIQQLWFRRRNLGKEYDSFQWRKLLWIGLGLAAYLLAYRESTNVYWIAAAVCIVGGALAHLIWRRLPAALNSI